MPATDTERAPLVSPWAVHPLLPAVTALACQPLVGLPWLAANAFAIRGSTRRPELAVLGVGLAGLLLGALAADEAVTTGVLAASTRPWIGFAAELWLLGSTLVAFTMQRARYDRHATLERFAQALPAPDATDDDPVKRAHRLAERGWLVEAEAEASGALDADPDRADAHLLLGDVHRMLGRSADAIARYERALALSPDDPAVPLRLAAVHAAAGRHGTAERVLRDALASWPTHPDLLTELGLLYLRTGRPADAQTVARHLAAIDPRAPDALAIFAVAWVRQGAPEHGVPMAKKALERDPNHPIARHAIGAARAARTFLLGDWVRHSDHLARIGRGWAMLPYLVGFALFELGPLVGHVGVQRAGLAIAVLYALFSVGGAFAYRVLLRRELLALGIEP